VAIKTQHVAEFVTLERLAEPGRRLLDTFLVRAQVGTEIGDPPILEEAVFAQPERGAVMFKIDLGAATERLDQEVLIAVGEERAAVGLLGQERSVERVPGEFALAGSRRAIGTILVPNRSKVSPRLPVNNRGSSTEKPWFRMLSRSRWRRCVRSVSWLSPERVCWRSVS
jgi:hypothetical protein